MDIAYQPLMPEHFEPLLHLANEVHGQNYLNKEELKRIHHQSYKNQLNASFVALSKDRLIGFRLTLAAGNWQPDKWCTSNSWKIPATQACYFKCNTVDQAFRNQKVGSNMLTLSIQQAKLQGAKGGLAHLWMDSPGNSAFKYFSNNGGELIKTHANRWRDSSLKQGYVCTLCGEICHCTAGEMIIYFD